jgi:hydroxymethylglutaryl-CoA lyase
MMKLPSHVQLCEVGPRDGFQFEETFISTDRKLDVIRRLTSAGLRRIQVTSFVHPKWVPQMADAGDVVSGLPGGTDAIFSGLALNMKGLERLHESGLPCVDISIATNETHSRDNANMDVDRGVEQAVAMAQRARELGLQAQMGFQTVFGYGEPGDTPMPRLLDLTRRFLDLDVESLSYADSTGMADPVMIQERIGALMEEAPGIPIVLHLHDTRGTALANILAALQIGIDRFDTSFGGLGGCPFIPGATGNVATEDVAGMLEQMGVRTGVDIGLVAGVSRDMETILGRPLPGRRHRLLAALPA